MRSAEGRKKAFTTYSSHLTVVSFFYGAAFYTYVLPKSFHTPEQDKVVSAFYTVVTLTLNPQRYGLSLPGSSVHGILQASILEWVAMSFSCGSSQPLIEPKSPVLQTRFFVI